MAGTRRQVKSRDTAWARRFARFLTRIGITPNAISITSAAFAAVGAFCLVSRASASQSIEEIGFLVAATATIVLRLLCNLFDGMVAMEGGKKTASGELFNDIPDRIS